MSTCEPFGYESAVSIGVEWCLAALFILTLACAEVMAAPQRWRFLSVDGVLGLRFQILQMSRSEGCVPSAQILPRTGCDPHKSSWRSSCRQSLPARPQS
eukprot:4076224-Amphidinium_carterae.9